MWCLVWKNSSLRNVYLLLTTFLLKWNHKGINFKCNFREVLAPLWIKSCWCWLELEKSIPLSDRLSEVCKEIHDYGEYCKYRHVRQATVKAYPWNKQTNIQMQLQRGFGSIVNQIVLVLAGTGKKRRSVRPTLWLYWSLASSFSFVLCVMRVTPKTGLNSTKLEYIHIAYLPQRSHSHQLYML